MSLGNLRLTQRSYKAYPSGPKHWEHQQLVKLWAISGLNHSQTAQPTMEDRQFLTMMSTVLSHHAAILTLGFAQTSWKCLSTQHCTAAFTLAYCATVSNQKQPWWVDKPTQGRPYNRISFREYKMSNQFTKRCRNLIHILHSELSLSIKATYYIIPSIRHSGKSKPEDRGIWEQWKYSVTLMVQPALITCVSKPNDHK